MPARLKHPTATPSAQWKTVLSYFSARWHRRKALSLWLCKVGDSWAVGSPDDLEVAQMPSTYTKKNRDIITILDRIPLPRSRHRYHISSLPHCLPLIERLI